MFWWFLCDSFCYDFKQTKIGKNMENDKQKTLHEKYVVNVKERFVILSIHDIYTIMHLKPMI